MEKLYEEVNSSCIACALCAYSLTEAASKCMPKAPILHVHPNNVNEAVKAIKLSPWMVNLEVDDTLKTSEWYIEVNVKRVGSIGC